MGTVEKFFAGVTVTAVVATLVASPYTGNILTALFNGIGNVYKNAKH